MRLARSLRQWESCVVQDIRRIALYLAGVLLLGAALAPLLFEGGRWLGRSSEALGFLERVTFQRYFNRAMLVAAIALLWPLARSFRIATRAELGLAPNPHWLGDAGKGLALALASLIALGAILLATGLYAWQTPLKWTALGPALAAAVAVAFLEEALFRGALLGVLRRSAAIWPAQLFLAGIFALVHFLKPPENRAAVEASLGEINLLSGFQLLPHMFWQFTDFWLLLGGFSTLFAVGLILGLARERTHSLWLPIGLHAGWVFGMKAFGAWTTPVGVSALPWIGPNLLVGLAPLGAVVVTGLIVARASPPRP